MARFLIGLLVGLTCFVAAALIGVTVFPPQRPEPAPIVADPVPVPEEARVDPTADPDPDALFADPAALQEDLTNPEPDAALALLAPTPEAAEVEAPEPALPPVQAFAADQPRADGPALAVILLDDGRAGMPALVAQFPYPLTIALTPDMPDARARMRQFREAGAEVVMLGRPNHAVDEEMPDFLTQWQVHLPEAIAVLEDPTRAIQSDRAVAETIIAQAGALGLGLITVPHGHNTVHGLARNAGVPAAILFRRIDGPHATSAEIRQGLTQAAGRARDRHAKGQADPVIVLADLSPDVLKALLTWGLSERQEPVRLAPVSHALNRITPDATEQIQTD